DVLSLRHGKRPSRAAAECWSNPSARQQLSANTAVRLVKSPPNLMQRLSRLPAAPNVTLLDRRKPRPHPSSHANTTFTEQIYIRWCCIDLSNAPRLSGLGQRFAVYRNTSRSSTLSLCLANFSQATTASR